MKALEQTIQKLILNGTLTECPGLFYGKTCIAVFFFHYARHTGNKLYRNYAFDLIEAIQEQITDSLSAQYNVGLAGIGAGFAYLLQNGFIEAEDSDFFEEVDDQMYRIALYKPYPDLGLKEGLTGWGRYFMYRMRGDGYKDSNIHKGLTYIAHEISRKIKNRKVTEKEQPDVFRFFRDLTSLPGYTEKYANALQQCISWKCINKPDIQTLFPYMNHLQRLHVCQNYFNLDLTAEIEKEWEEWGKSGKLEIPNQVREGKMENNSQLDMGLLNGWTAEGLLYLTALDKTTLSWMNLL